MISAHPPERRNNMALNPNSKLIQQVVNQESTDGTYQLVGLDIWEFADALDHPEETTSGRTNPTSISDPLGYEMAFVADMQSPNREIQEETDRIVKNLYTQIASADYSGKSVVCYIQHLDPRNESDRSMIRHRKNVSGWNASPDQLLRLKIAERVCGIFDPAMQMFVPSTNFRDTEINGMPTESYLESHPQIRQRYQALLVNMYQKGIRNASLERLLSEFDYNKALADMALYTGEMAEFPGDDVCTYISKTAPGIRPEAVCCMPGTNSIPKLLEEPVFIHTGDSAVLSDNMMQIGNGWTVIPPVTNCDTIANAVYNYAPDGSYLEFSAYLDGTLYHKIYTKPSLGWKICKPENIVDLFSGVPDGVLSKHNYLIQESAVMGDEDKGKWKIYPEDPASYVANLKLDEKSGIWHILQRSQAIRRLELLDENDNILGTIPVPPVPALEPKKGTTLFVSLDPAGAQSVRIAAVLNNQNHIVNKIDCCSVLHPLTPMAEEDLANAAKNRTTSPKKGGTHFDSMLQKFTVIDSSGWAPLMVESRVYQPDQEELFDALEIDPETMATGMDDLDIVSNPKEILSRSDLTQEQLTECTSDLKTYIGSLILESIASAAREGYSLRTQNLQFLVSYPENGSGEGITKQMKLAIEGALELVNDYLSEPDVLSIGTNVTIYSESSATDKWNERNRPDGVFLGEGNVVGTPDYGYSTHDFALRANGHLYFFSLPYAAQRLTNATLARVYGSSDGSNQKINENVNHLMRCFRNGEQNLIKRASEAIKKAIEDQQKNASQVRLYEQLGFILPLNRLFQNCTFLVNGANTDAFQVKVQQMVEAKLNIAVPAYADTIAKAIRAGDMQADEDLFLAPVGKGSLALNNTGEGFEERFSGRLRDEIDYMLKDQSYTGKIHLLPNYDKEKKSVSEGMIALKTSGVKEQNTVTSLQTADPTEHYLELVYGNNEEEKESFRQELLDVSGPAKRKDYLRRKEALYHEAFDHIISNYTYDMFEESFNRFGYTGLGDGDFDDKIRSKVKSQFRNLVAEMKSRSKALIMACPGIEQEMLCGAAIDLALER